MDVSNYYVPEHPPGHKPKTIAPSTRTTIANSPIANQYASITRDPTATIAAGMASPPTSPRDGTVPPPPTEVDDSPERRRPSSPAQSTRSRASAKTAKTAKSYTDRLRFLRGGRGRADTAGTAGADEADLLKQLIMEEDAELDPEERRLMPMYIRAREARKPNSRKALKWLGLA
jgi:hypothetical protein